MVTARHRLPTNAYATLNVRALDDRTDCFGHLKESVIQGCEFHNGLSIGRHRHQSAERCAMPVARSKDDRDDAHLAAFMSLHRARHLQVIAIIGVQEVGAHQKKNDVGGIQVLVDPAMQLLPGRNPSVVPGRDHTLAEQSGKVLLKFVPQGFVGMRVRHEDPGHRL